MNIEPAFEDDITPDHTQAFELVQDSMWQLGQLQAPVGPTPATAWLPLLKEAAARLEEARTSAVNQLLPDSRHALKMAQHQTVNPCWELAETYPEVRRICVVEVALFAVQWAIEDLQNEGRAPVQPGALKLSRTKRTQ